MPATSSRVRSSVRSCPREARSPDIAPRAARNRSATSRRFSPIWPSKVVAYSALPLRATCLENSILSANRASRIASAAPLN